MGELENLYLSFFKNLASWLPQGSPIVFIFPYWKHGKTEKVQMSECVIAKIEDLGYAKQTSLFYERPDQIVGREIIKFLKK